MRLRLALLILVFLAVLGRRLHAEEVDLELLLLVDVSRSMSPAELEIQRRGYAEALRSDSVAAALGRSLTGRIALAYVEWAGQTRQRVVVDWTPISGPEDLATFAAMLEANRTTTLSRTSITAALQTGGNLLDENEFKGLRRVIDISGDGPNNQGGLVTEARDALLDRGIIINGLPIMAGDPGGGFAGIDDLDRYYDHCVIGGPGAFVLPVNDWSDFTGAVTRKLVLEIAGHWPERLIPVQSATAYDCRIGEKMWERNRRYDELR